MPYSAYTSSFMAVLGRCASSAALTVGQMAARLNLPAPGVTGRGGRLPHCEGGAASSAVEGAELGVAEGDETDGVPAEELAGDCVTVAVVQPATARAISKAAAYSFLITVVPHFRRCLICHSQP